MSRVLSARSLVVALTAAALLALPALGGVASAAPAPAPERLVRTGAMNPGQLLATRHDTSIRFLSFDHTRGWLNTTRIKGQVTALVGGRRGAVKGVHVKLFRKLDGTSRWNRLATTRTGTSAYPRFVFRVRSIGNANYKVVFGGNSKLQRSSGVTRVLVHRGMGARLEDGTGSFHGRVRPNWSHRTIYLEKRTCPSCGWVKVRSARTGNHGHFKFFVPAPRTGRWWWRASVPATTRFIWSYTGVFTTQLT